ncbi:MAG TPA: hypothetical protein VMW10_12195 [Alphaproteobacteria bacterium]|nr:hypothetical protein [Alphaproteobacteria bacterium]
MKTIQEYINTKQIEFAQHPLFNHIRKRLPLQQTMGFAPYIAFWVMTFQDILRLNETLTKNPKLREFAHHHRQEDSGHERWFLQDLEVMFDTEKLTIDWLYGPDCSVMRDASYMIMAELVKAESDQQRTVLVLALESTSQIFSKEITSYIYDMGYGEKLNYFSKTHFDAENEHAMYEEEGEQQLHAIKFTPQEREKAVALVDYIYAIFNTIADELLKLVENQDLLKHRPNICAEPVNTTDKVKSA